MGRNQAQRHRTARSSGKGAPAYRASSRRPLPRRASSERPGPERVARRRTAISAGRRSRRPLLFYVLVASVSAQIAAAFAGMGVLVALFTLTGLLLSAVAIHAEG
jgi:hypothetical protein